MAKGQSKTPQNPEETNSEKKERSLLPGLTRTNWTHERLEEKQMNWVVFKFSHNPHASLHCGQKRLQDIKYRTLASPWQLAHFDDISKKPCFFYKPW